MAEMLQVEAGGAELSDLSVVAAPAPEAPGDGEAAASLVAATINPADLLTLEGRYGVRPEPPFTPGSEALLRIDAVGPGVEHLAPGDLALAFTGACWRERFVAKAALFAPVPREIDIDQGAMLTANPATALAMLEGLVELQPGDWVAQNAANSAVGVNVIRIARLLGLKTVNIVRRAEAAEALRALGADIVLVAEDSAPTKPEGIAPKLALDCVGGGATAALGGMVAEGGLVVNYGLLSGEDCRLSPNDLVFRDVRLHGFWLAKWFRAAGRAKVAETYARLTKWLMAGEIGAPVAARYPLAEAEAAIQHAAQYGRDGKILLTGPAYEELTHG